MLFQYRLSGGFSNGKYYGQLPNWCGAAFRSRLWGQYRGIYLAGVVFWLRRGETLIVFEQVDSVQPLDFTGYDVISDDYIYDLRGWTSSARPQYAMRMHARFQVLRTEEAEERPVLRIQLRFDQETMQVEYLPVALKPIHVRTTRANGLYIYQTILDFSRVSVETEITLVVRQVLPANMATQEFGIGRFRFTIAARTGLARIWVLLPHRRPHDHFELYRFPIDQPHKTEVVHATTSVEVPRGAIATFELINPPDGYRYECRWRWLNEGVDDSQRKAQ